jgi:ribosomal protein S18 acetylase RimI-like enzyme
MLADSPWAFAASPEDDMGLDVSVMKDRLGGPGQAVVGALEGERVLVATAGVYLDRHVKMAHRARVWGVYVTPRARGRGLGERVVRGVIELARTWPGVSSVGLSVSENAPAAMRLYTRLGFVEWGIEPGALRHDGRFYAEHHMCLAL